MSSPTVKAIHQIHGVKGFDVIVPNQVFECPAANYDDLIAAGAIEDYSVPEVSVAKAEAKAGKAKSADDGL